jgi:hypothetical protein
MYEEKRKAPGLGGLHHQYARVLDFGTHKGRVFDDDSQPVPDRMLEVWQADAQMAERSKELRISRHTCTRLVADYKAQALAIMASGCMTVMVDEAIINCVDLIRREVVPGFYVKGHVVGPRS